MHWTINGRRVPLTTAAGALEQAAREAIVAGVRDELYARFSRIRHPRTGETPTVVVEGDRIEAMGVRIEGSPELLALVADTLTPEEREQWLPNLPSTVAPKVFLGFGSEDQAISDRIAEALHAAGVEVVFYAPWDLVPGESIPAGITEGLNACTHFLTLWTPHSKAKPWVLQEAYAAFMRRMRGDLRFTIVRHGADAATIPTIMGDLLSPELRTDHFDDDLARLVRDVQGISRRPAPVTTPLAITNDERYTTLALTVARVFVNASQTGRWGDPMLDTEELTLETGLSAIEIEDATHELGAFLHTVHRGTFAPKDEFFAEFDGRWQEWDPATDALRIAADLVNGNENSVSTETYLSRYGWPVRRINPAVTFLAMRRVITISKGISHPLVTPWLMTTPETRRFVRSRSGQ